MGAPAPYAGIAVQAVMEGVKVHMSDHFVPDKPLPLRVISPVQSKAHDMYVQW